MSEGATMFEFLADDEYLVLSAMADKVSEQIMLPDGMRIEMVDNVLYVIAKK